MPKRGTPPIHGDLLQGTLDVLILKTIALGPAHDVPFARSLQMGLRSASRALAVNLVLAPAYILLLLTGFGTPLLFFAANGWLLGVDLGEMVAARHIAPSEMKACHIC